MLGCLKKAEEMFRVKAAQQVQLKLMEVRFQQQSGGRRNFPELRAVRGKSGGGEEEISSEQSREFIESLLTLKKHTPWLQETA